MNTEVETINVDEIRCDFSDALAKLGPAERKYQVRQFLENLVFWTEGTIEEESYLRALRSLR